MAKLQPWDMGDSARRMTTKFNNLVSKVIEMDEFQQSVPPGVRDALSDMSKELEDGLQSVNQSIDDIDKNSVGLGNVDNTSDADKPVSVAQKKAIDDAISGALNGTISARPVQEGEFGTVEVWT